MLDIINANGSKDFWVFCQQDERNEKCLSVRVKGMKKSLSVRVKGIKKKSIS